MTRLRLMLATCLVLGLAACATTEPASRGAALNPTAVEEAGTSMVVPDYDVVAISVVVPENLRVTEANTFFPVADIVWHGDPLGDRRAQVAAIFESAMAAGTAGLDGAQDITVEVTVTRFHALTPKARYTTGGMFTLHFILTLRDVATGAVIDGPRAVVADIKGSGGQLAMEEEAAGITQKVVIEQRLAEVILAELTAPVPVQAMPAPEAMSRQDFSPVDLNIVE